MKRSVGGVGMTSPCEPTNRIHRDRRNPSCGEVTPTYVAICPCGRGLIKVVFKPTLYRTIANIYPKENNAFIAKPIASLISAK
jgi:hypothetical protein